MFFNDVLKSDFIEKLLDVDSKTLHHLRKRGYVNGYERDGKIFYEEDDLFWLYIYSQLKRNGYYGRKLLNYCESFKRYYAQCRDSHFFFYENGFISSNLYILTKEPFLFFNRYLVERLIFHAKYVYDPSKKDFRSEDMGEKSVSGKNYKKDVENFIESNESVVAKAFAIEKEHISLNTNHKVVCPPSKLGKLVDMDKKESEKFSKMFSDAGKYTFEEIMKKAGAFYHCGGVLTKAKEFLKIIDGMYKHHGVDVRNWDFNTTQTFYFLSLGVVNTPCNIKSLNYGKIVENARRLGLKMGKKSLEEIKRKNAKQILDSIFQQLQIKKSLKDFKFRR